MEWQWLGRVAYEPTIELLEQQRTLILNGNASAQRLLLCEHDPVITIGRSGNEAHVLSNNVPIVRSNRGGDVTYHGPGQLMVYPVVRLRHGVVSFLEGIANALAQVLAHYGITNAQWQRDPAGLWLNGAKIAACGIHLRRGVTLHGFALNVATPAAAWQSIVPCGLSDAKVTSMATQLALTGCDAPSVEAVAMTAAPRLVSALCQGSSHNVGNQHAPAI